MKKGISIWSFAGATLEENIKLAMAKKLVWNYTLDNKNSVISKLVIDFYVLI